MHILLNFSWFCAHVLQWACSATKLSVSPDQRISPASVRHCSFSDHEFFQPCKLANMVFLFGVISPSHSCWRCLDQSGLVALESIWNDDYWFSVKCRQKIELSANRATWRENAFRVLNPHPPHKSTKKDYCTYRHYWSYVVQRPKLQLQIRTNTIIMEHLVLCSQRTIFFLWLFKLFSCLFLMRYVSSWSTVCVFSVLFW